MKLKNITPKQFTCLAGGCPALFENYRGTPLVIGVQVKLVANDLSGRIGPNDMLIGVPSELIRKVGS
jgi:hypothetical protein